MSRAVSLADVVAVPIESIIIGPRRREKLGRLQTLKKSIEQHGLIHPILLRGQTLIAGHRRLEACRLLEWKTIPARQVAAKHISDEELRALELDENTAREALSDYATSKQRLAQIRQAEADLKAKAELIGKPPKKSEPKRGRPTKGVTQQAVAETTGVSPREQVRTERHVEIAEDYPFMQRAGWLRHHVFEAADLIQQLPPEDRLPITQVLDQPGIPPEAAIPCLRHAVELESSDRRRVINLWEDNDPFNRRRALTILGQAAPLPDPSLLSLAEMARLGRKAAKLCRSAAFQPRIAELTRQANELYADFSEVDRKERIDAETVC